MGSAGVDEPAGLVKANASLAEYPGPELDAGQMTFADSPQAHDEPDVAGLAARLVRMRDHRGVEQRGSLERVLLREIGADEPSSQLEAAILRSTRSATSRKLRSSVSARSRCAAENRSSVLARVCSAS